MSDEKPDRDLVSGLLRAVAPTRHRAYGLAIAWVILAGLAWLPPTLLAGRTISIPGVTIAVTDQAEAGTFAAQAFLVAVLVGLPCSLGCSRNEPSDLGGQKAW